MEMTKELYESKMTELGLESYEELEAYRWEYSKEFEDYIQSLDLLADDETVKIWDKRQKEMHEEYGVILSMVLYGVKNKLFK